MPVRFDCPGCKANYEVADDLSGKMIMCRVCKKRGPVRSLPASASAPSALATASKPPAASASRRSFLIGLTLASFGAIGAGALLARQPWRHWGEAPESSPDGSPDRRWRRGPPPGEGKKDNKGGAV